MTKHPFAVATPTRPVAEISPVFGMSPHFSRYRDFLPLSRLVGFRGIRVHYIDWAKLEKEKGVWDWKELDEFMQLARKNGYSDSDITLNLMGIPRWASLATPEATWINICIQEYKTVIPKQMEDWKNFIRMVMRRYPGVKKYELWNEPHLIGYSCFWSDSVENFVALLKAGYETVKAENPEAIVHLGGIGMRYLPFYRELLKLGGDRYYDVLPMHGSWVQMAPFRRMEKEFGRKSKPWLSSEWHAMLLRASFPWPSEPMLTRNMLCDFLNQVRQGAEEVDFFCIVNAQNFEKECLPWMKKFNPGSASHVSGLFRKTPFPAPRYQAVAWHVLSDLVKGKLSVGEGFRFGAGQCAVALSSDAGGVADLLERRGEPGPDRRRACEDRRRVHRLRGGRPSRRPSGGDDACAGVLLHRPQSGPETARRGERPGRGGADSAEQGVAAVARGVRELPAGKALRRKSPTHRRRAACTPDGAAGEGGHRSGGQSR
ncbi:MAG: beta-galactosidase [Lentisphaeria bacterium]|nr:MAG: beta-galactosidase [Lentisphaeria bacterium]